MAAPLIAHVIHHLVIGGLENGLINLINRIPSNKYNHAIICIDNYSDFSSRICNSNVKVYAINKKPGRDFSAQLRIYNLLKSINPTILHSRNLSGLNALFPAVLAGVKIRIHGEHGRDIDDLDGSNKKLQLLRRLYSPLIHHYIPLSNDLENYLYSKIGVKSSRITQIYNGVDTDKFTPAVTDRPPLLIKEVFFDSDSVIIGTVGRFQPVKDQMNLAEGFIQLLDNCPDLKQTARLVMIGDGPLRDTVLARLSDAGYADFVWAPGPRDDVASLMQSFDIFVLPSLAEGISNTLLEAMSCGLPVIATAVGGNPELVEDGKTGSLIPAGNSNALSKTLEVYVRDKSLRTLQGYAARKRAEEHFSITAMVERYVAVYDKLLNKQLNE